MKCPIFEYRTSRPSITVRSTSERFALCVAAIVVLCHAVHPNPADVAISYEERTFAIDQKAFTQTDREVSGYATGSRPFRSVGPSFIGWRGVEPRLDIRASNDGVNWGPWQTLDVSADYSDASVDRIGFGLIFFSNYASSIEWKLAVPYTSGNSYTEAGELRFSFIDPGETPQKTLHTIERKASQPRAAGGKPPVVSRTTWGCPEGQGSPNWMPTYTDVSHIVVHHTTTANDLDDWPAVVRIIWAYHYYTNGWFDIGYNYLIDPNGVVYEGRAGGDNAIGAHFSCANSNTMGVALLGSFDSVSPLANALQRLEELLAWKCDQRSIDPQGQSYQPGTGLILPNVCGHRDANGAINPTACPSNTVCPGEVLYGLLPSIRMSVAELLDLDDPPIPGEKALKLFRPAIYEEVLPLDTRGSPFATLQRSQPVAIRVVDETGIDPNTAWCVVDYGRRQVSERGIWIPAIAGSNDNGWIVFTPAVPHDSGVRVMITVGADRVDGSAIEPLTYTFQVCSCPEIEPETPFIEEIEIDTPLDTSLGTAVSPSYRIGPSGVFHEPVTVQIPIPASMGADQLALFYFSESNRHRGWFLAERVTGFLVPMIRRVVGIDGTDYVEVQARHSGVLMLAKPAEVHLAGVGTIDVVAGGSWRAWAALIGLFGLLAFSFGSLAFGKRNSGGALNANQGPGA